VSTSLSLLGAASSKKQVHASISVKNMCRISKLEKSRYNLTTFYFLSIARRTLSGVRITSQLSKYLKTPLDQCENILPSSID
jgi:hypothetical protein